MIKDIHGECGTLAKAIVNEFERKDISPDVGLGAVVILFITCCQMHLNHKKFTLEDIELIMDSMYQKIEDFCD